MKMLKEELYARKVAMTMIEKDATYYVEDWRINPEGVGRKELLRAITALVRACYEDAAKLCIDKSDAEAIRRRKP
jgi:hypothetical protein